MDQNTARARIHAMFTTDDAATEELDRRIDDLLASENGQLRARVSDLEAGLPTMQKALFRALDRVTELEAQRSSLSTRLRSGQRWQRDRNPALVSQDYVSQDELRAIFGIALTAPWDQPA